MRSRLCEVSSLLTWCICMSKLVEFQVNNPDKVEQMCAYMCLLIQEARKHGGGTAGALMTDFFVNMPQQTQACHGAPWMDPSMQHPIWLGRSPIK